MEIFKNIYILTFWWIFLVFIFVIFFGFLFYCEKNYYTFFLRTKCICNGTEMMNIKTKLVLWKDSSWSFLWGFIFKILEKSKYFDFFFFSFKLLYEVCRIYYGGRCSTNIAKKITMKFPFRGNWTTIFFYFGTRYKLYRAQILEAVAESQCQHSI